MQAWNERLSFSGVEHAFQHEKIVSIQTLKEAQEAIGKTASGSHPIFKLKFQSGVEGVFKPNYNGSAHAEVDAYRISKLIHSRQVPPTVKIEMSAARVEDSLKHSPYWDFLQGLEGSVQYYVPSPYDLVKMDGASEEALRRALPKEKSDQKLFQFVFGQWDAHPGNQIVDGSGHLALIDNTAIQNPVKTLYGESPFRSNFPVKREARVSFDQEPEKFPFKNAVRLQNPTKEEFTNAMERYWEPWQIEDYWKARERSYSKDKTMAIVVWHNEVWIQGIGFQNYGTRAEAFSRTTLENYRKLDFKTLRQELSPGISDEQIEDYLDRRDQVLKAAEKGPFLP